MALTSRYLIDFRSPKQFIMDPFASSPQNEPAKDEQLSQRPTVSPYSEVQVLTLGWLEDDEDSLGELSAMQSVLRSYGYGVKPIWCKDYADKVDGPEAPEDDSVTKIVFQFQHLMEGSPEPVSKPKEAHREKLVIFIYAGHGGTKTTRPWIGEELFAGSPDHKLEFNITTLTKSFRNTCGSCDILTILDCCHGDFEWTPRANSSRSDPEKHWHKYESLAAGTGVIYLGAGKNGDQDFMRRLARDLEEHTEGWTVKERSDRIMKGVRHGTPGYYRRDEEDAGGSSIVLAPIAKTERLLGSTPGALLPAAQREEDFAKMGLQS